MVDGFAGKRASLSNAILRGLKEEKPYEGNMDDLQMDAAPENPVPRLQGKLIMIDQWS